MLITFEKITKDLMKISDNKNVKKYLILSGKGGVGKSTVAANLASAKALKGYKVGLLDVDLHGPSLGNLFKIKKIEVDKNSGLLLPFKINENLKLVTMQSFLETPDDAVIWRGPKKRTAIRQFINDVNWGELDYLFIDAPPGSGDETLAVLQLLPNIKPIMVSSGHRSSILDVKKAINFLKKLNVQTFGLIDNQSKLFCPHCNKEIVLYNTEAVKNLALELNINFLQSLPMHSQVAEASENGVPIVFTNTENIFSKLIFEMAEKI